MAFINAAKYDNMKEKMMVLNIHEEELDESPSCRNSRQVRLLLGGL